MNVEKKQGIGYVLIASICFLFWVVFAFINVVTWIPGVAATVMMVLLDVAFKRECNKVYPLATYIVGLVTYLMIGGAMGIPFVQVILCAIFMPLLRAMIDEMFRFAKENGYDYDDYE